MKDIFTPGYTIPLMAAFMYYYNFGRFITPENEHTIISRLKRFAQFFMVLWYPWLCHWPSGTVFYVFCNATLSYIQTSIMMSPWYMRKVNSQMMISMYILNQSQMDDFSFKKKMKKIFNVHLEKQSVNEQILQVKSKRYLK